MNKVIIILFLFTIFLLIYTCTDFESKGSGTVIINLSGSNNNNTSSFHAPYLKAPENISNITLTISGPGMSTITETYPDDITSIEIEVPAGNNREFNLLVDIDPSNPGMVLSWAGTALADIEENTTMAVQISMRINDIKLLVPDYFNSRLVMLNDWGTPEGMILNYPSGLSEYGYDGNFAPSDIDYDNAGNIYIVNNNNSGNRSIIIRRNDLTGSIINQAISFNLVGESLYSIAVDRTNNYIYTATDMSLFRCDLDGNNIKTDFNELGMQYITGIAVDSSGLLYISWFPAENTYQLTLYDPSGTGSIIYTANAGSNYDEAQDVIIIDNRIYLAVNNYMPAYDIPRILEFSSDLNTITFIGEYDISLEGPRRFIHNMSNSIIYIDEDNTGSIDRLIRMDDIGGTNLDTYGTSGSTPGSLEEFLFFIPLS